MNLSEQIIVKQLVYFFWLVFLNSVFSWTLKIILFLKNVF